MTRAYVVVEGQTEEAFVNAVLAPALYPVAVYVTPIVIGTPRHRGGRVTFGRVVDHLARLLKQESAVYCTTLVDYYGRGTGFPPIPPSVSADAAATLIDGAIHDHLLAALPGERVDVRCLPYVQVHEFEALLFSDPAAFAAAIGRPDLRTPFHAIRAAVATPEDINDDPTTAPSKRVLALHPTYSKVVGGQQAAQAVGLPAMRRACPRFGRWVDRLSSLGRP